MGKASFAQIQDESGRIQLFLQANALGDAYDAFKGWDVGDIVARRGHADAHQAPASCRSRPTRCAC